LYTVKSNHKGVAETETTAQATFADAGLLQTSHSHFP